MSSIRKLFASSAKDFELGVKYFQDAKVSVAQIFKLFKDFIFCAKECVQINDEDQDDINVILEIIYKFLNCILDYVGVGSITAKLPYLTTVCHEIYRATCDLQLTHEFVKKLSMPIFQVLLEPEVQTWTAKEILKMFSVTLQLIDRSVRSTLIEENFIYYIARFMDMLPFVDFEFQAIILEVLFRLYTQDEIKNKKNVFFFNTEQQRKAFYSIDTKKFDFSIRLYLNVVNEIENNIKSVLCYKVCMDECVLHAPEELSSFKGLWVDFNIKVRSISFYIGIHEYIENRKKGETMWEIVTIYAGNISSADISIIYNKEKEIQEAIGIIKLKGPCIMVRQVPQKLIKTTTITMYSTNVQKMKNIFNNDIPKMTNRKIKGSFVPLNRRGYKPLDIVSIKSSVTNHSSVLNHTINTDIVCNNSTKDKSSVKKAKRSICTKDKIKEKITKTNSYGESFKSQLIDIPPETNDKNHKQSYSYGEAFRTHEEVVSRNKMIKTDKSSCGYGEKFLSSLIDIDELFKDHDISPEGGVCDAETNKVVVRASTINKKLYPVCSEPKSIVLRSHVRNNENLSKTFNEKKINKTKVTSKSSINNNNPKEQIRKKTLKENKKQGDESSSHNSEVKKSDSIRRVNVSETHCSPELFSSQMEFSCSERNMYKSVSSDKIIFRDVIQTSNHLGSPDSIRDNCYIDPFDELKLEIPNRNLLLEENPKVDSTIEEQIPVIINEPEFELLRKPSNSDSVHIVPISSLSYIEPPDYFPHDDCKIDAFDALKLEIPNLESQGEKHPKVHSTIEEPIPIRMTESITEPLGIPANSSSDDSIKGDLKNSSLSFNNKGSPNSDQDNSKIDPFNKMKLKLPNSKLRKGENPELNSNNKISNPNLEATEDTKVDSNSKEPIPIEVSVKGNVVSQDAEFFETAKMYVNYDDQLTTKLNLGKSLELFNHISKNIDSSVASSSKNTDTEPHLPPEGKSRIRILSNIKIQSAFSKASKSNIHTSIEYEKSEVCGPGSQDKIRDSENIQIVPEGDVVYNGPVTSQEIEPDPDLKINMCNVSKTDAINVRDQSKNNLQKISCHNKDSVTDIKIKKSLDETLVNVKNRSTTEGICKRRKLYTPDFPELMSFTEASSSFYHQESKAVSSCLKPEKKLEENSITLTKIEGKKKSVERKQTKTQLEKVYLSENKRKNNKRYSSRSTNFKRLDEEFQEVLRLLKSGDYIKKRPSSRPKNYSKKKGDLFILDFSEFNADLERRGILKTKTNIKEEDNDLEKENNSRRNGLEKNLNIEGDDREIEEFLRSFGRFCGKLSSGQLKNPKTSTKKKLIAVCNILLDIC